MAALEEFLVVLKAQTGEFSGGLAKASGAVKAVEKEGGGAFAKLGALSQTAFAGIAVAAVGAGVAAIKLADNYEVAHQRLVVALKNTGTSWDAQKKKIEDVTRSGERLGFSMKDTEDALAVMTRGMGSSEKAIQNLGLAQDLARAKGVSLADAALIITRASEGQLRPLKQLGIDLPVAAGGALKVRQAQDALSKAWVAAAAIQDKIRSGQLKGKAAQDALTKSTQAIKDAQTKLNTVQKTGGDILTALGQKLKGSAAAQAETFGGKLQALKVQLEDVGVRIGLKLIPIIEKLATIVANVITWFEKHKTVAQALAITLGILAAALAVVAVVSFVVANAMTLGIGLAIAALVAGIVFLWQHWDQIWNWISHHKAYALLIVAIFPIIGVIAAIVVAIKYVYDHWSTIWPAMVKIVQDVWAQIGPIVNDGINFVRGIIDIVAGLLSGDWSRVWDGLKEVVSSTFAGIRDEIFAAADGLYNIMTGVGRSIWNGLIDGLESVASNAGNIVENVIKSQIPGPIRDLASHLPGLGWLKAGGGLLTGGMPYIVGEQGPELFMPGSSGTLINNRQLRSNFAGSIGGGGSGSTNIYLTVNALDPRAAEDGVIKALQGWARRNGPVPVKVAG